MTLLNIPAQIVLGEDSSRHFTADIRNEESLATWPEIDFASDHDVCLFTATVHRHALVDSKDALEKTSGKMSGKTSGKTSGKILAAVRQNTRITIPDLAALIGITERSVERNIQRLQVEGRLRRIGPAKGGHWEISE